MRLIGVEGSVVILTPDLDGGRRYPGTANLGRYIAPNTILRQGELKGTAALYSHEEHQDPEHLMFFRQVTDLRELTTERIGDKDIPSGVCEVERGTLEGTGEVDYTSLLLYPTIQPEIASILDNCPSGIKTDIELILQNQLHAVIILASDSIMSGLRWGKKVIWYQSLTDGYRGFDSQHPITESRKNNRTEIEVPLYSATDEITGDTYVVVAGVSTKKIDAQLATELLALDSADYTYQTLTNFVKPSIEIRRVSTRAVRQ